MNQSLKPCIICLAGVTSLTIHFAVFAEEQQGIEEIVVTAQKRAENSQDVPLTMTTFSDDFLAAANIHTLGNLATFAPGFATELSSRTQPQLYIRGLGTNDFGIGSDPSVGVYIDGIYIGRPGSSVLALTDIERIEVLKGPQGTLFGRNTSAGAISIITKKPTPEREGQLRATLGNYNKQRGEFIVNEPLTESVMLRASMLTNRRDGFIKNQLGGADLGQEDDYTLRTNLLWQIDNSSELILRLDTEVMDQDGPAPTSLRTDVAIGDPYGDVRHNADSFESREVYGVSLTYTHEQEAYVFTSQSSFRKYASESFIDEDGADSAFFELHSSNDELNEQFTQEFRLNRDTEDYHWFIGTSYFQEAAEQASSAIFTTDTANNVIQREVGFSANFPSGQLFPERMDNTGQYQSAALYGDLTYDITARFQTSIGLRYTRDQKDFDWQSEFNEFGFGLVYGKEYDPAIDHDHASWSELTPRLVLDYAWSRDMHTFFSITEGYKAGGFNALNRQDAFDPETMLSYEVGLKSTWLDHRVRCNVSTFFYDYQDLQVQVFLLAPGDLVPNGYIQNASDATGEGIEFEMIWLPSAGLYLSVNGSVLKAEFDNYMQDEDTDLSGNTLPYAPDQTLSFTAEYEQVYSDQGSITYRIDFAYTGEKFFYVENDPLESQGGVSVTNLRMTYLPVEDSWEVSVYANNAFNKEYATLKGGLGREIFSPTSRRADPQLIGIEGKYRF